MKSGKSLQNRGDTNYTKICEFFPKYLEKYFLKVGKISLNFVINSRVTIWNFSYTLENFPQCTYREYFLKIGNSPKVMWGNHHIMMWNISYKLWNFPQFIFREYLIQIGELFPTILREIPKTCCKIFPVSKYRLLLSLFFNFRYLIFDENFPKFVVSFCNFSEKSQLKWERFSTIYEIHLFFQFLRNTFCLLRDL